MDEMDFVMHASDPPHSQTRHHPELQSHSQSQGCPYFRSDHGHPTSLPNPFSHGHHQLYPPYLHPQGHPASGFPSSSRGAPHPPPQHLPHTHSHYDPVHAASSSTWYSPPNAPFQWPAAGPVSLPSHQHQQLPHARPGPSSEPPYFAGVGGGPVPVPSAGAPGTGPGPIQPGLLQNQYQFPPHQDPFGLYSLAAYRQQPSLHHRFPPAPPPSQNHPNSGLHSQAPPPQHIPQTQPPLPTSQMPTSGDRPVPSQPASAPRVITLPAPNPLPNPAPAAPPAMATSSGDSSPDAPPASRPSLFSGPHESPRSGQNRGNPNGSGSSGTTLPQPPRQTLFGGIEPTRADIGLPPTMPDADPLFATSTPPVPPNTERRRGYAAARMSLRRVPPSSDEGDSDEELVDSENEAISFLEQFAVANPGIRERDDEFRIRAHQILRGQLSNKRVASKKALSQLQSVDLSTLEESERTCVICYNEFGVSNPEGVNEAPLRLPNCKHIFGDHCIKKWFEESDSCPYCRDKVHSEPAFAAQSRALHHFIQTYSNGPRFTGGRENRPLPNGGEPYVRIMATSTEPRYDSSPPRVWQNGGRRSPPSEGMESRRRTRPRHGSFRGSPSTNSGNNRSNHHTAMNPTAPLQQSPGRERVNPPFFLTGFDWDPPRSLTRHPVGQFMPMPSTQRPYSYTHGMGRPPAMQPMQHAEPLGLTPPSMHSTPISGFGTLLSPVDDQRYQVSLNGSGASSTEPGHLPGPAQITAYSQPLPSVGALDGSAYAGIRNAPNSHSNPAGEWLQ